MREKIYQLIIIILLIVCISQASKPTAHAARESGRSILVNLNFPPILPNQSAILTVNLADVQLTDSVIVSLPDGVIGAVHANYQAWVSAVGVVSVKCDNLNDILPTGTNIDPNAAQFRLIIMSW